jgi:chitodextrinase
VTHVRVRKRWSWIFCAAVLAMIVAAIPLAGGAGAATPACQTSGPAGGAYTVTVCLSAPADGATVSGQTTVTATVSRTGTAPPGTQRVVFYLDGQYLLTDYSSTYTFVLPSDRFVDGTHRLEVEALMRDGFTTGRTGIGLQFLNGVSAPPVNTNAFTPTSGTAPPSGQPVVLAAVGDGAGGEQGESDVVNLIQSWNPNLFLYLGDVYEKGSLAEFYNWYGPSSLFGGLRSITDPAVGNHEYTAGQAPGYFDYWDNAPHYYSVNAGSWHIVSLDSTSQFGQSQLGTAQYTWLANDLNANRKPCTLVYYHHPVFNIGQEGYYTSFNSIWSLLALHGVDVVLNGHDHTYQRWQPLNGSGTPSASGITEFVAGTGGHSAGGFVTTDSRLAASATGFGALQLTLNQGGAGYAFVSTSHAVVDSGSIACHSTNDTAAPSVPTGLAAAPISKTSVDLSWDPASDNVGVTGYDLFRDGNLLASLGPQTSYSDLSVSGGNTYSYQVRARDAAGNLSALSSAAAATTPTTGNLFAEGFESGDLSKWTTVNGLTVQQQELLSGSWAAEASGNGTSAYAWKDLSTPRNELYLQLHFKVLSQGANSIYLARLRTATGTPLVTLYLSSTSKIGYRNETTSTATTSTTAAASGAWHTAQVHVLVNADTSTVEVWLDGTKVDALSGSAVSLGTTAIGRVELGDSATSQSYDVAYDDIAYDSNLGSDTTPPSAPTNLAATAHSGFQVNLTWTASTDDTAVAGYDLYRNGVKIGESGAATTSYADTTTNPLTYYYYTVQARDAAGNASPPSDQASLTTPDLLSDDFETGDLTHWTTVNGIVAQQDTVYAGTWAARAAGSNTAASATTQLARTTDTLDTRVRFKLESQSTNVTLLRYRTAGNAALVSVFVSTTGKLGLRNDTTSQATTSATGVSAGSWHELELQATAGDPSSRVDVLLDGNSVPTLSGPATLGTTPIGRLELGETATNRTFSVAYDNLVADTASSADVTPPSAPTSLAGNAVSSTEIDLTWNASSDNVAVTGYRISRDGTAIADTTGTSYQDTNAGAGTSHTYTVQAYDAAGNLSDPSNTITVSPLDTTPPTTPTGLTATAASATHVDLSWTASTDNLGIDHYLILRGGNQIGQTNSPTTSYSDLTTNGTTTYTYTVQAVDTAGNTSTPSNPAPVTTPDGTPPSAPTGLAATAASSTRVDLSWTAATDNVGVDHYLIARGGNQIGQTSGPATSYSDLTVVASTTYTYEVKAVDGAGNVSAAGNSSTVTTLAPPTPSYLLTVSVSFGPSDSNYVTGPGINCGRASRGHGDCSEFFASGTVVTLTAVRGSGSVLGSWSSNCTPLHPNGNPTNSCTVTMNSAKTVTAFFVRD